MPLCTDGSGRECKRFCWKEHIEAGGVIKVEDPDNIKKIKCCFIYVLQELFH